MARTREPVSATKRPKKSARAAKASEQDFLRLEDQLCFPLYLASRLVVNAYRPLLSEVQITYPQYLVLLVLWGQDGLSVSAIGELLHLDSGTLTPLLRRMEKQGLITRRRQGKDDRVVENWLTAEAKAIKKRVANVPVQLLCAAKLGLDEMLSMKRMLQGLIERLLPLQSAAEGESLG